MRQEVELGDSLAVITSKVKVLEDSGQDYPPLNLDNMHFDDSVKFFNALPRLLASPQSAPKDFMLSRASMRRVVAQGIMFCGLNLGETDLTRANLENSDLQMTKLPKKMHGANLSGTFLQGADLAAVDLKQVHGLHRAFFDNATNFPENFPVRPPCIATLLKKINSVFAEYEKPEIDCNTIKFWLYSSSHTLPELISRWLNVAPSHSAVTGLNKLGEEYLKATKNFKKELIKTGFFPVPEIQQECSPRNVLDLLEFLHNFWDINKSGQTSVFTEFWRKNIKPTPVEVSRIFGTRQGVNGAKLDALVTAAQFGWEQTANGYRLTPSGCEALGAYLLKLSTIGTDGSDKRAGEVLKKNSWLTELADGHKPLTTAGSSFRL